VVALRSITGLSVAAGFAALCFALPLSTTTADAQVYYSIYGGYRNSPPQPYRDDRPRSSGNPFVDFFGSIFGGRPYDDDDKKPDAFGQYCVRTCDGKFFPVSRGGRKELSLDKICSAMCPAAQTKVFSGLGIDNASANDGQRYTAIPNAFAYRTKIVDNCTCNGRDPFGVAKVDLENDITLQGGDLVVQQTGFALYRGGRDFVPIERAGMSPGFVKQMQAIKVLPDNPHATFAKTMPVMHTAPNATPAATSEVIQEPEANTNAPAATRPPARTN
jgi:hypothetical protein